jgi:hypothetical protein
MLAAPCVCQGSDNRTLLPIQEGVCSSIELPLTQFAAVRKGAPAKTFLQDIDE